MNSKIDTLFKEAVTLQANSNYEEALYSYNKILKIDQDNAHVLYHRAMCFLTLGMLNDARKDLLEYVKKVPNADHILPVLELTFTLDNKFEETVQGRMNIFPAEADQSLKFYPYSLSKKIDSDIFRVPGSNNNNGRKNIDISVVVPVKDEEGSLASLYKKLKGVLDKLNKKYEIIFVDDGSTDRSIEILTELSLKDSNVVTIKFRRNYGQTAAFAAGFKYASGEIVITMDADLQNDPMDIPELLEKMAEGYDLVCGWRKNRQDKVFSRKIPSWVANRIINKLIEGTGIKIHDAGCSLKAYKKGIVKNIKIYGEMHRFIPAYAAWLGIKVAEIPVSHHPRFNDNSKYGIDRVGRVILDLITLRFYTGFKTKPFQFFGKIAATMSLSGIVLSILLFLSDKIFSCGINLQTFILMVMFSILGGLQFIVVGLLSEIIMRGFLEAQDKEEFVIEDVINCRSSDTFKI